MEIKRQSRKARSVDGLSRKRSDREDSFFADLDSSQNKFGTFWVVSILIFLVIFITLIVIAANLKRVQVQTAADTSTEGLNLSSFSDRLSNISSIGAANLVFNGQEFTKASGAQSGDFPLKDSKFTFSKDNIILSGKVRDSLIPFTVKIKIKATAEGGKFLFLVEPNSFENIVIYGQNKDKIEKTFDQNINQSMKDKNVVAKDIVVSNDRIELQVIKEIK